MNFDRLSRCLVLAALVAPAAAEAQGFGLNEIGSCAVARGFAVTSVPCNDPSEIYWNPAATTALQGWGLYVGAAAVQVNGGFNADSSGRSYPGDVPVKFPPHIFLNYRPKGAKWAVGIGSYVPYGLVSQWTPDFPGRFESQYASLSSDYIQPNFAYRIAPGWSIGGGPVFGVSHVELRQGIDLAAVPAAPGVTFGQLGIPAGTQFAAARLKGSGTAWGFNVGVHGKFGPDWQIGARYLSELKFKYNNADVQFTQQLTNLVLAGSNPLGLPAGTPLDAVLSPEFAPGAPFSAGQHVNTEIDHPAQLQAGIGYTGLTNTTITADYAWIDYKSFKTLEVNFVGPANDAGLSHTLLENYKSSSSVRIGVEHAFAAGFRGRVGFDWIGSPAPDETVTPLLPDMSRRNYTIGIGLPLGASYTLDAGFLHVDTGGRRGRIIARTVGSPAENETAAELNSGFYTLNANVFSLSLKVNF
ncbi:MAG: outer membrane protein transport protein [Gemmatimonadaceae bacterium]|nr:outer membrane protein transport protein [Gemmatimonadaceae bacterium]